jgi:hypothetical protein
MQALKRVLDEVGQLALTPGEDCLDLLAVRYLGLERLGLLLEQRDLAKPCIGCIQAGVTLRRNHVRMVNANLLEGNGVRGTVESIHRISAEEAKRVRLRQLIPELLEVDRRRMVAFAPEQSDHLAEGANSPALLGAARYDPSDRVDEAHRLRSALDHELLQHLLGIEQYELPAGDCGVHVVAKRGKVAREVFTMAWRRDHDAVLARA